VSRNDVVMRDFTVSRRLGISADLAGTHLKIHVISSFRK
jgi:hypothetical protein